MPKYAVVESNNVVSNIIVADSVQDAEELTGKLCIQYSSTDSVGIGYVWDGTSFNLPQSEVISEGE